MRMKIGLYESSSRGPSFGICRKESRGMHKLPGRDRFKAFKPSENEKKLDWIVATVEGAMKESSYENNDRQFRY